MQPNYTICFLILPYVHLMDLSGPVQVFYEASYFGPAVYKIQYCGINEQVISEQGLALTHLADFRTINLKPGDFIFVPGIHFKAFQEGKLLDSIKIVKEWMKGHYEQGVNIASICSGSLILAEAGLLNGRRCTSHWKCVDYIKQHYPKINIQSDCLYTNDSNIYTSAGMTSGIDMALSILEVQQSPVLSARVAREMVVYLRRNDTDKQQTIYLDYRTHFNPVVHKVQDYIISHPGKNPSLEELASIGNTSIRTLTRLFKKATGHTIIEFKTAVKMELARTLIHNTDYTMERIASYCGFESARHLRRLISKFSG